MRYQRNSDLPHSVRSGLPLEAQAIYREAFNKALEYDDGPGREDIAHQTAWEAVKRSYVNEGGQWVPKGVPG